jgi:hypothetical protein
MGYESRGGFEIEVLVFCVEQLVRDAKKADVQVYALDELPQ